MATSGFKSKNTDAKASGGFANLEAPSTTPASHGAAAGGSAPIKNVGDFDRALNAGKQLEAQKQQDRQSDAIGDGVRAKAARDTNSWNDAARAAKDPSSWAPPDPGYGKPAGGGGGAGNKGAGPGGTAGEPQKNPFAAPAEKNPRLPKSQYGSKAPGDNEKGPDKLGGSQPGAKRGGLLGRGGKQFASYARKHPRGMIMLAGGIISLLLSIVVALFSVPLQLIHIAELLKGSSFGPMERLEQRMERRLMVMGFQRATQRDVVKGEYKATGRFIQDTVDNWRIDRFNKLLAKDNLRLEFNDNGRLTGIRNTLNGEVLTDFSESSFMERRAGIGDIVSERIAPWRIIKRVWYTRLLRFHARVSWRFWPKEKMQNGKDFLKLMGEKVRQGATADEATRSGNPSDADKSKPTADSEVDTAAEAANEAAEDYNKNGDKAAAMEKSKTSLKGKILKGGLGLTAIVTLVCTVQALINNAVEEGYVERTQMLMRFGNIFPTAISQTYFGEFVDFDKFGALMSRLQGNPNAPEGSVDRLSWEQSEVGRRLNDQEPDLNPKSKTFSPPLPPSANPDGFALAKVADKLNSIVGAVPGGQLVCNVLNSWFGWVIQGIEFAVVAATGGLLELVLVALQGAFQYVFLSQVVEPALASLTHLEITGTENAVDTFSMSETGHQLSAADLNRSMGGALQDDATHGALVEAYENEQRQIAQAKGWQYRIFSLDNPRSVLSMAVMKVPTNPQQAIASLTNLPNTAISTLGQLLSGQGAKAIGYPQNPNHIQFYGFTQAEIDKYDPLENEIYLTTPVGDTGKSRLDVLGDPTKYSPADGEDPNTDNLHHCFVNTFRAPSELEEDEICHDIGIVMNRDQDGSKVKNPTDETIRKIYDENGLEEAEIDDDFLRYRVYRLFVLGSRAMRCAASTDNTDCFGGTGASGSTVANTGPWKSGASCEGVAGDPPEGGSNGAFAKWRGATLGIAGTWNDNAAKTQAEQWSMSEGGSFKDWDQSVDNAVGGHWGMSWADDAAGKNDDNMRTALQNIYKGWGNKKTVYLRFAHEFNGDWYKDWRVLPSDNADFIKASRHFYDLVQQELVQKGKDAKVVFAPNSDEHNGVNTRDSWPGDDKVDVVGVDFYDWDEMTDEAKWQEHFNDVGASGGPKGIGSWQAFAKEHGKPIAFPEWGESGYGADDNPFFMQRMNQFFRENAGTGPGNVLYEVLFNCYGYVQKGGEAFLLYPEDKTALPKASAMYKSLKWGADGSGGTTGATTNTGIPGTGVTAPSSNAPASTTNAGGANDDLAFYDDEAASGPPKFSVFNLSEYISGLMMQFIRNSTPGFAP